jgi:hypothetical protein
MTPFFSPCLPTELCHFLLTLVVTNLSLSDIGFEEMVQSIQYADTQQCFVLHYVMLCYAKKTG